MRIPILIVVATSLAVSAAPAMAQDTNTANAAETSVPAADANMTAAVPPVDGNMAVTTSEVAPVGTVTAAEEPYAAPRAKRDKGFPWGVLGLLGLVGLMGRRRSDRS